MAEKLNITFDEPEFAYASPDHVIMRVTGHLGDQSAWSVGEASKTTSQNKYYAAMAEKRAKDRVILKLIGASGDAYSEEESDDFRMPHPARQCSSVRNLWIILLASASTLSPSISSSRRFRIRMI